MRFSHCPVCGCKLTARALGDDGLTPWCDCCQRPWFDSFSTCIITAVMNPSGEVLLQREARSPEREVLVAGYMKPGESAEDAVLREIAEETGLTAHTPTYIGSWPHKGGDQLMLGFLAPADGPARPASPEVLVSRWAAIDQAIASLREGSIAQQLLLHIHKKRC